MALEQEVDRSCQAESGKHDKQDQVHRFLAFGLEAAEKNRPVKRKELRSKQ
jgi:hypothetical protein